MIKKIKHNSMFFKLILSYFTVLLIPVLSLSIYNTVQIQQLVTEDMLHTLDSDASNACSLLDNEIKNLEQLTKQLALSTDYSNYRFETNILYSQTITKNLLIHTLTNDFSSQTFFYFNDSDYILTPSTTCKLDLFTTELFQYANYSPEEIINFITSAQTTTFLPLQNITYQSSTTPCLTIIVPVFSQYQQHLATAVYIVEDTTLTRLFSNGNHSYAKSSYLISDTQILAKDHDSTELDNWISLNINQDYILDELVEIEGKKYYLSVHPLGESLPLSYVTLIPKQQPLLLKLSTSQITSIIAICFVIMISSIIIILLTKRIYNPIKTLAEKAHTIEPFHEDFSEFENISHSFDSLKNQNVLLNAHLDNHLSTISNSCLQKLLSGGYTTLEQFNQELDYSKLHFSKGYYFVVTLVADHYSCSIETIFDCINTTLNDYFESHYVYTLERSRFVTINCVPTIDLQLIDIALSDVHTQLQESLFVNTTIGIGNCYPEIQNIAKSYLESKTALDYQFIHGKNTLIYFDMVYSNNNLLHLAYPNEEFKQLNLAIKKLDKAQVSHAIDTILNYLKEENISLFTARGICFDLLKAFTSNKHFQAKDDNLFSLDITDLSNIETVDDIILLISHIQMHIYSDSSESTNHIDKQAMLEQILDYIHQHCFDPSFSVQQAADHFHMQLSNFSQLFKDLTDTNILDYMIQLRMEKATVLLCTTSKTLKEIGLLVGYQNVSSFIRRFKDIYGMTPGDYRKSH